MNISFVNVSLNLRKMCDFFLSRCFGESLGGYLLEIQDQEENEWITQKMLKAGNVMTTLIII